MTIIFLLPFFLQGAIMIVDEFYFHRRRDLPRWERLGHPLDTATVGVCYLFLLTQTPTPANIAIYSGLAVFSCFFVTKDEFVHARVCKPQEMWLHSLLFILHPITFGVAALIWLKPEFLSAQSALLVQGLQFQLALIVCFFLYQSLYWNVICKTQPK